MPKKGGHHTEEGKRKIRDSNRGKKLSAETKQKISQANKGKPSPRKGVHLSEKTKNKLREAKKHISAETRCKMSKAKKGYIPWNEGLTKETDARVKKHSKNMKGRTFTEEHKQNLRLAKKHISHETRQRQSESAKRRCQSEKERKRMGELGRKARLKIPSSHTKPELKFGGICKSHNLHFKYVGDGSLWIGKTKKLNPDFVQADGEKIVVEVMGDYWHSPLLNQKLREDANLNYRKRHYKKYGWKSLFIWESDLIREDAEQFVLHEVQRALRGGVTK